MQKFSVLMSLYYKEQARYLDCALNSVFTNSIQPDQVVMVLDGPIGDDLREIVDKYKSKYNSFDVYPQNENRGLSFALNYGLKKCRNELVFRMDTDDICYPDRFEKMLYFYDEHPFLDMAGSFDTMIDENGSVITPVMEEPTSYEEIKRLIWTCPFSHPTMSFKKSSIQKVGSYNPDSGPRQDDYELWFRCIAGGLYAMNYPEPLLYYRFFNDSLQKNNVRVGWWRMKVGIKGCWMCKCSPLAYIGVCFPFIRSLLPLKIRGWLYNFTDKYSPKATSFKKTIK